MLFTDIDALEQEPSVLSSHFVQLASIARLGKRVLLKPFLPKVKACFIPVQYLRDSSHLPAENIITTVKRTVSPQLLNDRRQPTNLLPHVRESGLYEHSRVFSQFHADASKPGSVNRNYWLVWMG
jgi:hypothetical protein